MAKEMDKGSSLKSALQDVVEQKLLGTYRIAVLEIKNPKSIIFVKNSGDFSMSLSKNKDEIIVSSELSVFLEDSIQNRFQ